MMMKQTEIGLIPEDWEVDEIHNFSIIKTGSKNTQDKIDDGQYPFFVRSQKIEKINSYCFEGEAVLTAGDGVGVGKVFHYINGKFDLHQRVYSISNFKEKVYGFYFFKYFQNNFLNRIMQMTAKSSVDSVRMDTIAKMKIPLPPLPEQHAIAEVLSDTDHWITSLENLIAKKQLIKQGAMQKLLTPKQDWEVKKLGDLTKIFTKQTGFDYSAYIKPSLVQTKSENDIPFIQNKDFNNKWINLNTDYYIPKNLAINFPRILLNEKSLLISISGAIGNIGVYERNELAFIGGAIAILKFKNPEIIDWVMYYLKSREGQLKLFGNVKAGSHQNLILDDIRKIEIPIPKIEKQTRIATILSDMDAEIEALEQKLIKARQIKQGLMQELLTGRIRLVQSNSTKTAKEL